MTIALIIISVILFVFVLNYAIFGRSLMATIVEFVLWLTPFKRNYKKAAKQLPKQQDAVGKVPRLSCKIEKTTYQNMPVYVLTSKKKNINIVALFIHGGAYIKPAKSFHWRFVEKLVNRLGITMVVPLYPLAPEHKWNETHPILTDMYKDIIAKHNGQTILIGDSAGGGMAAALCMTFAEQNINLPDKTILLSPWVDITMLNPEILKYEKKDPMLEHTGARVIGKSWAGNLDAQDYRVSPKYGNCRALEDVYIFAGTREILFPDIVEFYNRCDKNKVRLFVQHGMNHDYPLFPIPEAYLAYKHIKRIITK